MALDPRVLRAFRDTFVGETKTAPLKVRLATVTNVQSGAATDGNAQVTISLNGASQFAPYLNSAPANGATVAVLLVAGSPLILGTVKGMPTF